MTEEITGTGIWWVLMKLYHIKICKIHVWEVGTSICTKGRAYTDCKTKYRFWE
jgi:hypothetical protein